MGHSVGELAAAAAAGVFSLEDGCRLVAARGRLMQALPAGGAMVSVEAREEEVRPLLAATRGEVSLAAVNGPRQVVISGDEAAVLALAAALAGAGPQDQAADGVARVPLAADGADAGGVRRGGAAGARTGRRELPLVSNLTGRLAGAEVTEPTYWVRHVREAVRFADGVADARGRAAWRRTSSWARSRCCPAWRRSAVADPARSAFVATLRSRPAGAGDAARGGRRAPRARTMRSTGPPCSRRWAERGRSLADLRVRAAAVLAGGGEPERRRYAGCSATDHPLLGLGVESAAAQTQVFVTQPVAAVAEVAQGPRLYGEVIAPGTTILEMCRAALAPARPDEEWDAAEVHVRGAAGAPGARRDTGPGGGVRVGGGGAGDRGATAAGATRRRWTLHATATAESAETAQPPGAAPSWPEHAEELWDEGAYQRVAQRGLVYGPAFRGLESVVRLDADTVLARASLPKELEDDAAVYGVHPALLDAALHAWFAMNEAGASDLALPFWFGRLSLWRTGARAVQARLRRTRGSADGASLEIELWDQHGAAIGRLAGVEMRVATPASVRPAAVADQDLYRALVAPGGDQRVRRRAPRRPRWWRTTTIRTALALVSMLRATDASVVLLPVGAPLPVRVERIDTPLAGRQRRRRSGGDARARGARAGRAAGGADRRAFPDRDGLGHARRDRP